MFLCSNQRGGNTQFGSMAVIKKILRVTFFDLATSKEQERESSQGLRAFFK